MGRTRSVALIALVSLLTSSLLVLSLLGFKSSAEEQATVKTQPKKMPSKPRAFYESRWVLGLSSWNEKVKITRQSDNKPFDASSSLWSLVFGYQWHRLNRYNWGLVMDLQALYGKNATESRDSQLVYYKNNAPTYGADFGVGGYKLLAMPNVTFGLGIDFLWRNVSYTEPSGYMFSSEKQKLHYAGKFSISWPLSGSVDLVQQFSMFIGEPGNFWLLGLRF